MARVAPTEIGDFTNNVLLCEPQLPDLPEERGAGWRQRDAFWSARNDFRVGDPLQTTQTKAQRRLTQVELLRGASNVFGAGRRTQAPMSRAL